MSNTLGRYLLHPPALRTSRLSSFALNAVHAFVVSQSDLPQQQIDMFGGSGECAREKSDRATVRSSMVAVALRRLLGESGVSGRECRDIAGRVCASTARCVFIIRQASLP